MNKTELDRPFTDLFPPLNEIDQAAHDYAVHQLLHVGYCGTSTGGLCGAILKAGRLTPAEIRVSIAKYTPNPYERARLLFNHDRRSPPETEGGTP